MWRLNLSQITCSTISQAKVIENDHKSVDWPTSVSQTVRPSVVSINVSITFNKQARRAKRESLHTSTDT